MIRWREQALDYIALNAAHENIGIYPQKVIGGAKPYEKRSDWQEGWNACVIAISELECKISDWIDTIPAKHKLLVEAMLLAGQIHLHVDSQDEVHMSVNCNDTFAWGGSDLEEITFEELEDLTTCYAESPGHGDELWAARKRGMRPQWACYKRRYPESEWPLFDAAGPERTDPDGLKRS